jgi:hypothetical protein
MQVTSLNAWRGSFDICEGRRGAGKKGIGKVGSSLERDQGMRCEVRRERYYRKRRGGWGE